MRDAAEKVLDRVNSLLDKDLAKVKLFLFLFTVAVAFLRQQIRVDFAANAGGGLADDGLFVVVDRGRRISEGLIAIAGRLKRDKEEI